MPKWIRKSDIKYLDQSVAPFDLPEVKQHWQGMTKAEITTAWNDGRMQKWIDAAKLLYIEDPILPNVRKEFWKISGNSVVEMTQAEKDSATSKQHSTQRNQRVQRLNNPEEILRALMLVCIDEVNRIAKAANVPERTEAEWKTAIRNKLGT